MGQTSSQVVEVGQRTSVSGPAAEWINRRATEQATRAAAARRISGRRRFVDPTTCDRMYSEAELEFMKAMNDYKNRSGRMFPTWSEVLEVLHSLGYEKVAAERPGPLPIAGASRPRAGMEPRALAGATAAR